MRKLQTLWRGDLHLGDAFWTWALFGGLIVNVITSILFLVLISHDMLWLALIVGKGFSLPYNLVTFVGVWRSAAQYVGPSFHADFARVALIILMTGLSLT